MTGVTAPSRGGSAPYHQCEGRDRRNRRLGAGRRAPPPGRPRHHDLRGRRPHRRARQHRRRRGRRRRARGRHRLHRLQRGELPGLRGARCASSDVATQPTDDELRRQRPADRARVPGLEPQLALRPAPQPREPAVPPAARRDRPLQPRRRVASSPTRPRGPAPTGSGAAGAPTTSRSTTSSGAAGTRRASSSSSSSRSAPRSGRPTRRPSPSSRCGPTRGSCTTTVCSADRPPAVAHDHRRLAAVPRRAHRAVRRPDPARARPVHKIVAAPYPSGEPSGRAADRRGPGVVRPRDRRDAQRPGAADARRRDRRPNASILGAIGYQPNTATLHTDAPAAPDAPARARELELPGRPRRAPGHGHVLDEQPAGHRVDAGRCS